jgi:hypothetical protein
MMADAEITVVTVPLFMEDDTVVDLVAAPPAEAEIDVDLLVELWFDEIML